MEYLKVPIFQQACTTAGWHLQRYAAISKVLADITCPSL